MVHVFLCADENNVLNLKHEIASNSFRALFLILDFLDTCQEMLKFLTEYSEAKIQRNLSV